MSNSSIMSVREMIDTCFGEPDVNIVNFKLIQTILYLLARQQRLLERRVAIEFGVRLVPRTSSLSITEVKLKANIQKKKKKTSTSSKGEKSKTDKTSYKSTTDETSTTRSISEPVAHKPTKEKTKALKPTAEGTEAIATDKSAYKSSADETKAHKSTKEKTKASKPTTQETETTSTDKSSYKSRTDETKGHKSTKEKTKTLKSTTEETEPITTDKSSYKSSADETKSLKSTAKKIVPTTTDETSSKSDKTSVKSKKDQTTEKSLMDKHTSKRTTDKTAPTKTTDQSMSENTSYLSSSDKTTKPKSMADKRSPKSTTDKTTTSELSSEYEARTKKTKKTDYHHLLELVEEQREQELRVVNQRADSREVADKTPSPMASLDSMEVQYEKLLVVERVPVEEAEKKMGRLRDGKMSKLDVVTQEEFDELVKAVKEIQKKFGIVGETDLLRRGSSMTDAMAALQLSARIQTLEKTLALMESMVTKLAIKKGVKVTQDRDVTVHTYTVQETQKGVDTPETKLIYDAPRGPSNISEKTIGETEDIKLSEPPLNETEDPIMTMLEGVSKPNINIAELDEAMQELYDELIKTVGSLTNKAINKADTALKMAFGLEQKLDEAIDVDTRLEELESLVSAYTGKVNVLDANLSSQMSNYQEQLTQMQHDLEGGLEAMAEALANPPGEVPGAEELNANFTNMLIQLDIGSVKQKDLEESQGVLSLDVQALWKEIELLRDIKSDRDEVADALRDKAGLGELNGLVTQQQFDAVRGDFEKRIGASYDKFNNQELIWQKIIDELLREINEKADCVQVAALRDDIYDNLEKLQNKIRAMAEIIGEPRAATISRLLFRDAACLSCSTPAHMNMEESTLPVLPAFSKQSSRPPTIGAEDTTKPKEDGDHGLCYPGQQIPHARDPRSQVCRRYCGGAHTTARGTSRRAPAEIILSTFRRETTGVGSDGKVYKMDEQEKEKKPCVPCNIPNAVPHPSEHDSEVEKDSRYDFDSETARFYVLPVLTSSVGRPTESFSVTPPPPLDDDY